MKIIFPAMFAIAVLSAYVLAGPIAMGLCQTACNTGYGVRCVSAGAVAGK